MTFRIQNINRLVKGLQTKVNRFDERAGMLIKIAVRQLIMEMMANIPVWSGRTVESITVSNTGAVAPLQGPPSATEISGFGPTVLMELGEEPQRPAAERAALATVDATQFGLKKPVFITVHSEAWGLVEQGRAPDPDRARNTGVVSAIALSKIRSQYDFLR